jgi:hypothetical protein
MIYEMPPSNGVNDNDALTAAAAAISAAGGGTILFGTGTWLAANLKLTVARVIFRGTGSSVIKRAEGGGDVIRFVNRRYVKFEDLHFDGDEENAGSADVRCLKFTGCTDITIRDCSFTRGGQRALDIRGCKKVLITGCRAEATGINPSNGNGGAALHCDKDGDNRMEDVIVAHNYIGHAGDTAIGVVHGVRCVVSNNIIRGARSFDEEPLSTEAGISSNAVKEGVIQGNIVSQSNAGIHTMDRNNLPIENVAVVGNICNGSTIRGNQYHQDARNELIACNVVENNNINLQGDAGRNFLVSTNVVHRKEAVAGSSGVRATGTGPSQYLIANNLANGFDRDIEIQGNVDPVGSAVAWNLAPVVNVQNGTQYIEKF